jgi:hypothetical protein
MIETSSEEGIDFGQLLDQLERLSSSVAHVQLVGWSQDDKEDAERLVSSLPMSYRLTLNECHLRPESMNLQDLFRRQSFAWIQSDLGAHDANLICSTIPMHLKQLNLSYCPIGDQVLIAIAACVERGCKLEEVELICCLLADSGVVALAKALSNMSGQKSYLKKLVLSANGISDTGIISLCETLTPESTLTDLQIGCNPFGPTGLQAISDAIQRGAPLSKLFLHGQIPRRHALPQVVEQMTLIPALQQCSSLEVLNLSLNFLCDEGAKLVAQVLDSNRSIRELYLTNCCIGDEGLIAIADSLHKNNILEDLWLSYNQFQDGGLTSLAHVLESPNSALKKLELGRIVCRAATVCHWREALQSNESLVSLDFIPSCASLEESFLPYLHLEFQHLRSRKMQSIWGLSKQEHLPLILQQLSRLNQFGPDLVYHTLRNRPEIF